MKIPKKVLAAYDIGKVLKTEVVSSGLIHQTHKIKTNKKAFFIQRLHPVLATKEIAEDFLAVTEYLHQAEFLAPRAVLTKKGKVLASDGKHKWRMQTAISGKTVHSTENPGMIREAGAMYARFHKVMTNIPHRFKAKKALHDTEAIYKDFLKVVKKHEKSALMDDVRDDISFIKKELPKLFLPKDLPKHVIHGDPKISNILFDTKGKAVTVVDLDTCNRRTVLVELGDAFRSWCGLEEDNPKNPFRVSIFRAGWNGYKKEAGDFLTKKEIKLIPQAIGLITLELASRFLMDYFNDDYFGWDEKRYSSRREHNLARVRGQISLYNDLQKKLEKVNNC